MKVIVLDTETANILDDPLCYDIGWCVVDLETEEVIKTESFAVAEIFLDKELMTSAYFAEKIPGYWKEIKEKSRKLARLKTIKRALFDDVTAYDAWQIYAHNARFDYHSCTKTQRLSTSSKWRYFFPYGTEIHDTLKMARAAFRNDANYRKFCLDNGFVTKQNVNRYTAEVLYRYISGNTSFEEEHKGLADVLIEKEILLECRRRGVTEGKLFKD